MHPESLALLHLIERQPTNFTLARSILIEGHHFHVSKEIASAADVFAVAEWNRLAEGDEFVAPVAGRLPGNKVAMTLETGAGVLVYLLWQDGARIGVGYGHHDLLPHALGRFQPGSGTIADGVGVRHYHSSEMIGPQLSSISMILSLINEPRRVSKSAAIGLDWSRQHRKSVERLTGKPALAYTKVTWQVGAGVKAKATGSDAESGLRMPLHWCRGHWRKAEEKWDGATWVSPRISAAKGWHIWIDDVWKGHPDHGIKLQDYAPRMIGEKSASRGSVVSVPNAVKWAAMSAQQRAIMAHSGFAPSSALH